MASFDSLYNQYTCYHHEYITLCEEIGFRRDLILAVLMENPYIDNIEEFVDMLFQVQRLRLMDSNYFHNMEDKMRKVTVNENAIEKQINTLCKKRLTCIQCENEIIQIAFIPCGHFVLCRACFNTNIRKCLICDQNINEAVNVFL